MTDRIVYRIATNKWNLKSEPWRGALGIEQVELWPDGSEVYTVPALICWLTRCDNQADLACRIVAALNSADPAEADPPGSAPHD
jgi:hypothetical protein